MHDKLELPFLKAILNSVGFGLVLCFKLRGLQLLPLPGNPMLLLAELLQL